MDQGFRYVQVYTGDTLEPVERRRRGIAIEPMTCPANAFRTGTDVIRLEPGGSWRGRWGISVREGSVMVEQAHVVVVGGGFAGLGCAHELAKHPHHARVTLIDRHDYHQFLPLLYQVATFAAGRRRRRGRPPRALRSITIRSRSMHGRRDRGRPGCTVGNLGDGRTIDGDYLVLAAGSQANFFGTPGAEHAFPLYSLDDARRLRARILELFEDADRDHSLVDKGALTFVVVGAGATGTEVAGALADLVHEVLPTRFPSLAPAQCSGHHRRRRQGRARAVLAQGARLRARRP